MQQTSIAKLLVFFLKFKERVRGLSVKASTECTSRANASVEMLHRLVKSVKKARKVEAINAKIAKKLEINTDS